MKVKMKRILGLVISLTLVLGMLPGMSLTAYADETKIGEATYTISGDVLTVGSGSFTIDDWASEFGTGGTKNATNDAAKKIKSVTFESGATLTSDNIKYMFYNWTALESVDLSKLKAESITAMNWMFGNCSKLTSVTFGSGFATENVKSMAQMFQGCSGLTKLDLSSFKNYSGTGKRSLYQTFYGCTNLETIKVIDEWNVTSSNTEGTNTFKNCNKLVGGNGTKCTGSGDYKKAVIDKEGQSGYLTSASASSVHHHSFTYSAVGATLTATCSADGCTLTDSKVTITLTAPAKTVYGDDNSKEASVEGITDFNTATGANILTPALRYYRKESTTQLASADSVPGEYTVKAKIQGIANNPELTLDYSIAQKEIGLTWGTTEFNYDGQSHVPAATATGLVGNDRCDVTVTGEQTNVGTYTATASSLSNERYKLPENKTTTFSILAKIGTAPYNLENGVLTVKSGEFTKEQWAAAFQNNTNNITSVKFEGGAKLTDSAEAMFYGWTGLTSVDLSGLDISAVTSTRLMFYNCTGLAELDLSALSTANVTNMQSMFYNCSKLKKIVVGDKWSTEKTTSSDSMFYGCTALDGHAGTTYTSLLGALSNNASGINADYAHIDGGTKNPGLFYNNHEHSFTYAVDSQNKWTITATCKNNGCYLDDSKVALSIVKPTLYVYWMDELNKKSDGTYDKSASPYATLTMQTVGDQTLSNEAPEADADGKINGISISAGTFSDAETAAADFKAITGADISDSSIEYYEGDTKLDSAPKQAGTYTARITVGEATASVDYRIVKRFHSPVTESPAAASILAYTGESQNLITAGTVKKVDDSDTSALQYALGNNDTTIPTEGWSKDIPAAINARDYYVFYKVVGDKNHADAMESEFPNKSGYAGDTYNKPAFSVIKVTIAKADPTANAPTGLTATYGQTLADVTLTNPEGNTAGTWTWADATTTSVGNVGTHTFKANFIPTDTANYNAKNEVEVTVTVNKANAVPATVTANNRTYDGTEQSLITVDNSTLMGGTMYYAVTTENTAPTDDNLYTTSIPTATDAGTYYVWYKVVGDANHNDTNPAYIKVTISAPAPTPDPDPKPAEEEIVVPVSGDESEQAVPVSASISTDESGTTSATVAEVTTEAINEVAEEGGSVTIDLTAVKTKSGEDTNVTSVTVSAKTVESVIESKASSLEIKLDSATAVIDGTTLETLAGAAKGDTITLVIDKDEKAEASLSEEQKAVVEKIDNAVVLDAYFISGGKRISDFQGGTVQLTASFESEKPVTVLYIDSNGNVKKIESTFDAEKKVTTFKVNHFSNYVITETKANTLTVKAKRTVKLRYSKLKKKARTIKLSRLLKVSKAIGTVSYSRVSVKKGGKSYKKYFTVNSKTGKVTVKKGLKKGTYTISIKVKAAGENEYAAAEKTVKVKVKVR